MPTLSVTKDIQLMLHREIIAVYCVNIWNTQYCLQSKCSILIVEVGDGGM